MFIALSSSLGFLHYPQKSLPLFNIVSISTHCVFHTTLRVVFLNVKLDHVISLWFHLHKKSQRIFMSNRALHSLPLLKVQFTSVTQLCLTLCDPMNRSTPSLSVHHKPLEFTQTHAHQVGDAIKPSHPLSSPSPPVPNLSQHQGLFQRVNSSHEVANVLEFQLHHQSFQ